MGLLAFFFQQKQPRLHFSTVKARNMINFNEQYFEGISFPILPIIIIIISMNKVEFYFHIRANKINMKA